MSRNLLKSIFVAVPNMGWLRTGLFPPLVHWMKTYGAQIYTPECLQPQAYARNYCVERLMETNHTHILFVDADVKPELDAMKLLLDADKQFITGVYRMQKQDVDGSMHHLWMVARDSPEGPRPLDGEGIESIDYCGFGLVLIEREVFETVKYPWFEDRSTEGMRGDFLFCKKVREAGLEMYAHFGVRGTHRKEVDI